MQAPFFLKRWLTSEHFSGPQKWMMAFRRSISDGYATKAQVKLIHSMELFDFKMAKEALLEGAKPNWIHPGHLSDLYASAFYMRWQSRFHDSLPVPHVFGLSVSSPKLSDHFELLLDIQPPFKNSDSFLYSDNAKSLKAILFSAAVRSGSWTQALRILKDHKGTASSLDTSKLSDIHSSVSFPHPSSSSGSSDSSVTPKAPKAPIGSVIPHRPLSVPLAGGQPQGLNGYNMDLPGLLFESFFYSSQSAEDQKGFKALCERLHALGIDFSESLLYLPQFSRLYGSDTPLFVLDLFIALGANPNHLHQNNDHFLRPLWHALCIFPSYDGIDWALCDRLLSVGADASLIHTTTGRTALHYLSLNERLTPACWPLLARLLTQMVPHDLGLQTPDHQGIRPADLLMAKPQLKDLVGQAMAFEEQLILQHALIGPSSQRTPMRRAADSESSATDLMMAQTAPEKTTKRL